MIEILTINIKLCLTLIRGGGGQMAHQVLKALGAVHILRDHLWVEGGSGICQKMTL